MIMRIIMATDISLADKFTEVDKIFQYTINYFQERNYGKSVVEAAGAIVCQNDYQLQFIGLGQYYGSRKKYINFLFKFDFEEAKRMTTEAVVEKSIALLIEAAKKFTELKIRGFDAAAFVSDLEEYLAKVYFARQHGYTEQFPELNADTVEYMRKKWETFLKNG